MKNGPVKSAARLFAILLFGGVLFMPYARATHQKAAEITVTHVSGYTYKAVLLTYTFTQSPADRPELELFWGDGTSDVLQRKAEQNLANQTKVNYYEAEHTYSGPGTYVLYMEDPNRNAGVVNLPNSVTVPMFVSSTLVISPWLGGGNSGPRTTVTPVADNACLGRTYIHNPGAYDPEGDLLTYRLVPCRGAGGEEAAGYTYPAASDTLYMETYSGNLVWKNPMVQGEYNVAILIEQWRNNQKTGNLTRDMQIIVRSCANRPPEIQAPDKLCVTAGDSIFIPLSVSDPDGNPTVLDYSGELLTFPSSSVRLQRTATEETPDQYGFYWKTRPDDSRLTDYQIYFRAEDNGDPHLSTTHTVAVKVNAPAVEFTSWHALEGKAFLTWNRPLSSKFEKFLLYRRDFYAAEAETDVCTTGLPDSNYFLLAEIPASDTLYTDTSVKEGRRYCYRLVYGFEDGDESYASAPVCLEPVNISPLITRVSVEYTHRYNGVNVVCWQSPQSPPAADALQYILYRGTNALDMQPIAEVPYDTAVCYLDSALNTRDIHYSYRVEVENIQGERVSSVYLTAQPRAGKVYLEWYYTQPWHQRKFHIYRAEAERVGDINASEKEFTHIGSLSKHFNFVDTSVQPRKEYFYFVKGEGGYESEAVPQTLYNNSNRVGAVPLMPDPCKPYLFLASSSCNPLKNILVWDYDSTYRHGSNTMIAAGGAESGQTVEECEEAADYYEVYRKYSAGADFEWLANTTAKRFEDNDPGALFCWYSVRAVNEAGTEGPLSAALAADNWHCFRFDVPNVFTPNNDGTNDVWRALTMRYIENFEIRVVNRWGVEVFRSNRPDFEWNGCLYGQAGKPCPDGAYFYYAVFKTEINGQKREKQQSGSITILR